MKSEPIHPGTTVNDVLLRCPPAVAVFNRFGIDACCGGGASLGEAASRDGADLKSLLEALQAEADAACS